MAIYSFTPITNTALDCGIGSVSADNRTTMYLRDGTESGFNAHNQNSGYLTYNNAGNNGSGLYVSNRTLSNARQGYRNGSSVASDAEASTALSSLPYIFGARILDGSVVSTYSNRGFNWFSIGKSLSAAQQTTFSTIINTFQTALSRNAY